MWRLTPLAIGGLSGHAGEHGLIVQDAPVTIRGGELGQLKVVGSGFQTALQIIETDGGQEIERGGRGGGYVVVGGSSIAAKGEEGMVVGGRGAQHWDVGERGCRRCPRRARSWRLARRIGVFPGSRRRQAGKSVHGIVLRRRLSGA